MEKLTELRTYRVDWVCAQCGKGRMIQTGELPTDYPPRFPHRCSTCGCEKRFDHIYPRYTEKDVEVSNVATAEQGGD